MSTANETLARDFECFRGFSADEMEAVARHLEAVNLKAGATLFRQGDAGDATYLLASGQVDILINNGDGPPDRRPLYAGAIFGEIAPLLHQTRSGSAVAATEAALWRLPYASLLAAVERGESWAGKFVLAMAQTLARRLLELYRETHAVIADLHKHAAPAQKPRVAELEQLRKRLLTEWAF